MARIPYPDPSHEQTDFETHLNLFHMLAHAETTVPYVLAFGGALLSRLTLKPRLRELVILQVAHLSGSCYLWTQHRPIALLSGITEEELKHLQSASQSDTCRREESLLLQFTTLVYGDAQIPDVLFIQVTQTFSPREIVEVLLLVGYYRMLARIVTILDVEIDSLW